MSQIGYDRGRSTLYPIIVWQGSIKDVWSFSKITIKNRNFFIYFLRIFFFRCDTHITPIGYDIGRSTL